MSGWEGLNRRKFPRVNFPCLVKIESVQNSRAILTHTENVSIGGVCVTLKEHFKAFYPVDLELDLMDMDAHIKCSGKIVWCVQRKITESPKAFFYDTGIEFQNLSKEDKERIQKIVDHAAENQSNPSN